jgi:hypothetical protein
MTFPETLNTKVAVNELRFPLVTHTAYYDARFDSYGILKSGRAAENFSGQNGQTGERSGFSGRRCTNLLRFVYEFRRPLTQLFNSYSHTHFR